MFKISRKHLERGVVAWANWGGDFSVLLFDVKSMDGFAGESETEVLTTEQRC
jgi:hypothetical protein